MARWKAPAWVVETDFDEACVYYLRKIDHGSVVVYLNQQDYIDASDDGTLTIQREPACIELEFSPITPSGCNPRVTIETARAGIAGLPELAGVGRERLALLEAAVAELLAAYDRPVAE